MNEPKDTKEVGGASHPIIVTYRKIIRRPVFKKLRSFVGVRKMLGNVADRILSALDDVCFDYEQAVIDPGEIKVARWALDVPEPFGMNATSEVVATRLDHGKLRCEIHLEVNQMVDAKVETEMARRQVEQAMERSGEPIAPARVLNRMRPSQDAVRQRLRESLMRDAPAHAPTPASPASGAPSAGAAELGRALRAEVEQIKAQARNGAPDPFGGVDEDV